MQHLVKAAALSGLAAVILAASMHAQTTLTVPAPYATIQSAINASRSGDTVLVSPGVYRENIDFLGRNIHVVSRSGPAATTIDGGGRASVVTIRSGEGPSAILEGFTITNGQADYGAGVFCEKTSPTIRGNHIIWNSASGILRLSRFGGGICCSLGAPLIDSNLIQRNLAGGTGTRRISGYGGGIALYDTRARVVNNMIVENTAQADGPWLDWGAASGGGVWAYGNSNIVVNNTVCRNYCIEVDPFRTYYGAGGVSIGNPLMPPATQVLANTIIRENWNQKQASQLGTWATTVSYCNVEGGYAGTGNFDADPQFGADYRIRYASPCRERGTNAVAGLPATDYEGDPRVVYGKADVGADEFNFHLTWVGDPRPGGYVFVKVTGPPGQPVLWAYSVNTALRSPPLPVPGAGNPLWLSLPMWPLTLGAMPAKGEVVFGLNIPPGLPTPLTFTHQALVGYWLTNVNVITVN